MGNDRIFDIEKVDEAIAATFDGFERLELTMLEVFHVIRSIDAAIRGVLGDRYAELAREYEQGTSD